MLAYGTSGFLYHNQYLVEPKTFRDKLHIRMVSSDSHMTFIILKSLNCYFFRFRTIMRQLYYVHEAMYEAANIKIIVHAYSAVFT